MPRILKYFLLSLFFIPISIFSEEKVVTPTEVYGYVSQLEGEIELLKKYFNVNKKTLAKNVEANLYPRHVWQKVYMLLIRLNMFRSKHGMARVAPAMLQPMENMTPLHSWAEIQRVLAEFKYFRYELDINGESFPSKEAGQKRVVDVYNKLSQVELDLQDVIGEPIGMSFIYSEVLRLNEDINNVITKLEIEDLGVPPQKIENATLEDGLKATFVLMEAIQSLQKKLGVDTVDFTPFYKTEDVSAADIFNMVGMCIAEMQFLKAKLGLKDMMIPIPEYRVAKNVAEVTQLLGYTTDKLKMIKIR